MNEVFKSVVRHHNLVKEKYGENVIYTCLGGSQNYGLEHSGSDIDTFTFVLPSLEDLASAKEPVSTEFWTDDGKCSVKDLRLAMNLLIKASPNSIEWFTSKYIASEEEYSDLLMKQFLNPALHDYIHTNYQHMIYAIAGMGHQLSKRNMPAGKRYSHALRVRDMWDQYLYADNPWNMLDFREEGTRIVARMVKLDPNHENLYEEKIRAVSEELNAIKNSFVKTPEMERKEAEAISTVRKYEKLFMEHHLKKILH